jgi:hypothetical protein
LHPLQGSSTPSIWNTVTSRRKYESGWPVYTRGWPFGSNLFDGSWKMNSINTSQLAVKCLKLEFLVSRSVLGILVNQHFILIQ